MTDTSDAGLPQWYLIDALLNSGAQVMPDWDWSPEELEALAEKLGRSRPLADPVTVAADGTLLDGRQRLTAMQMAGRARIYATDVHVIEKANRANALDYMVELNASRRHLTPKQRQELACMLVTKRRWTQVKVAKFMNVTQGRVSQWVSAERADLEDAETVPVGGTEPYPSDPAPREPGELFPAWSNSGKAYKALRSTARSLGKLVGTEPMGPMDAFQINAIAHELKTVIDHAMELQDALTRVQSAHSTLRRHLDGEPEPEPVEED